ncbi:MAG: alcohol dehydrogenase catalytic domain-containing protein [Streptosporangiales bacterium]|nr:alcohol dehydrogenase catalytic domain-containing protein [Streptosporangiales bacterium]
MPGTRAVLLEEPGRYRVVSAEPADPGPGEARVRVAAAGLCGSDREMYAGTRPKDYVRYPVVPGHEWSGTVDAVGSGVAADLVGASVVGEGVRSCLICARCRAGEPNLCTTGYDETGFTLPGAFSDHLLLPARMLHVLAPGADLAAAALLEPAACVIAGVLRAGLVPAERAAIVGAGTLGMLAAQLVAAYSPAELLVIDPRRGRAELAERCGATAFRTPDEMRDDAAGHRAGYDAVIECAGAPDSARIAASLARRGGRVVLTGIPGGEAAGLSPAQLVLDQLTVATVFSGTPESWATAVRAFNAGVLDPRPLVTHELSLEEYGEALRLLSGGAPDAGKILLHP